MSNALFIQRVLTTLFLQNSSSNLLPVKRSRSRTPSKSNHNVLVRITTCSCFSINRWNRVPVDGRHMKQIETKFLLFPRCYSVHGNPHFRSRDDTKWQENGKELTASICLHSLSFQIRQKDVRPGFLAGNSVFWRETTSVNIVSTASYKTNHNAAIRKQMWFTFLTATD